VSTFNLFNISFWLYVASRKKAGRYLDIVVIQFFFWSQLEGGIQPPFFKGLLLVGVSSEGEELLISTKFLSGSFLNKCKSIAVTQEFVQILGGLGMKH
jgi:hypothetical protein